MLQAINRLLIETYTVNGEQVKGQALSALRTDLKGVLRLPSSLVTLEALLIERGYKVSPGVNSRGQACRVVHL
jgi:hypothetical protein